ncbi:5'/3'-nucleotidase SurE [Phototrophicus methaneseepsis]|uniref:5'-nucleotidase SurE n=1 Tax=Phototrophicus methaneseepsis TaxID=2710758 RepID=A0A7S8EAQ0_9CHLR|nr:5'/3'-nucleotidase SurE [Phototrophicus methaneseepsis]QPC83462.1 5'/3'-nucleotidase SurE [Phototrophicus methaneseepsis]
MSDSERPLILFTNDDGVLSPGLWAVVRAFVGLGDLLVVAPQEQQSGMGRSMPRFSTGVLHPFEVPTDIPDCVAYGVDGTPAQAVQHGVLELADRKPALCVSGINYGDNTGNGVTISGTVGAAIEAASLDVRAIAVSQQTPFDLHLSYSDHVDFSGASYFTRYFGEWLVQNGTLPDDVDVLKIDVPWQATPETEWCVTRLSRRRVYWPTRPERVSGDSEGKLGYRFNTDPSKAESNSDVYVLLHEGKVSVTPISLDMTARTDFFRLQQILTGEVAYGKP